MKLIDKIKDRKNYKEVNKLYKEEIIAEKRNKKEQINFENKSVDYRPYRHSKNQYNEYYLEPKPFNEDFLNSSENTLIINANSHQIKKIKKLNNKKRKKDECSSWKNSNNHIIDIINVSKDYISGDNKISRVLVDINLKIKRGDFVVLFGKSGSGKSTLLNIISGLDRPTGGHVIVNNNNLPYLSSHELTQFRRNNISFIFQQYHLLNNITGYENVETGLILQDKNKQNQLNIDQMFEDFELSDVIHKFPSQMSGGQQQRVSILRALAKNSDIIFADEPTGALDKNTSDIVMNLLKKINEEQGKTIIMVSHDPEIVKYAKRKIFLNKGKIISDERINSLEC